MTGTIPFRRPAAAPVSILWRPKDLLALTAGCRKVLLASAVGVVRVVRHDGGFWRPYYTVGFVRGLDPEQACDVLLQIGAHLPAE